MIDFDTALDRVADEAERARHWQEITPTGALTIDEMIDAAEIAESMAPQTFKAETTDRDISGQERRASHISLGRLWYDCGRAVDHHGRKYRARSDIREALQTDVMALIIRWPLHGGGIGKRGHTPVIDLGARMALQGARLRVKREPTRSRSVLRWMDEVETILERGSLPLRRTWIRDDESPEGRAAVSPEAWRALSAATSQALRAPHFRCLLSAEDHETIATDLGRGTDFDAAVEAERRALDLGTPLPDVDAPDDLARMLGCGIDAARWILRANYPGATRADWANVFACSLAALDKSLQRGERAFTDRWGDDPIRLLDDIDAARVLWRERRAADAHASLIALAAGEITRRAAMDAVSGWRAVCGYGDYRRLAAIDAARRVCGEGEEAATRASLAPLLLRAAERDAVRHVHARTPLAGRVDSAARGPISLEPWRPIDLGTLAPMLDDRAQRDADRKALRARIERDAAFWRKRWGNPAARRAEKAPRAARAATATP